jgi:hypothetical protein
MAALDARWSRRPFRAAPPAFLFFGVFSQRVEVLDLVGGLIEAEFGPLDPEGVSPDFDFPETRTYGPSMGSGLRRRFYVLGKRWPQDALAPVKLRSVELEDEVLRRVDLGVARPVNIDPGLINDCRIVLASTKDHAHRLYRGDGIWEEVTLVFRDGAYQALPWTYRDFLNPAYHEFFSRFRRRLLQSP